MLPCKNFFTVVLQSEILFWKKADPVKEFCELGFSSVSYQFNDCYYVFLHLQVSLSKAEEDVLQTSATTAPSSLKLFHSLATLKNLNRNGKLRVCLLYFMHGRMGLK